MAGRGLGLSDLEVGLSECELQGCWLSDSSVGQGMSSESGTVLSLSDTSPSLPEGSVSGSVGPSSEESSSFTRTLDVVSDVSISMNAHSIITNRICLQFQFDFN